MKLKALFLQRETQLALLTVLMIGVIGLRAPGFISSSSFDSMLTDSAILVMLVLAQMSVIVTRGIDLSVASNLALTGMIVASINAALPVLPVYALIGVALVIGLLLGALNGLLIGWLRLPPIVITLGTMSVFRGGIFLLSGGDWITSEMSPAFVSFPLARVMGLTHLVWFAVVAVCAWMILMRYTRFGRDLYAIGSNPSAAQFAGVPVTRRLLLAYAISGMVAGFCGYLWVAKYAIAYTEIAYGFELTVVAGCVIGGISIAGGTGTVAGAVLGALFIGLINNALPVIKVSPFWQGAVTGIAILVAVIVNSRSSKVMEKHILPASHSGVLA
ncbi:ABC transporter permease [Solimonas sp. K1W22B-7]|uniref:ABC transporter permease n=1 Tax=Solimonas sp. K1W22B-7 TaxID=2303331 RepID=UPI000E331367|nr:ABC transporter permease [Solimonas sp. K1W22B-7]AXQ30606.1 ABC transporter permease [Solimonas sp. K1W22B-7]